MIGLLPDPARSPPPLLAGSEASFTHVLLPAPLSVPLSRRHVDPAVARRHATAPALPAQEGRAWPRRVPALLSSLRTHSHGNQVRGIHRSPTPAHGRLPCPCLHLHTVTRQPGRPCRTGLRWRARASSVPGHRQAQARLSGPLPAPSLTSNIARRKRDPKPSGRRLPQARPGPHTQTPI